MADFKTQVTINVVDNLSPAVKKIDSNLTRLLSTNKQVKNAFAGVTSAAANFASEIKVASLVVAGAVTGLAALTVHHAEAAQEMLDLSERTGVSTAALQKLSYTASLTGISAGEMAQSFKFLNRSIGEAGTTASSDAATAFNAMGISVRDASGHLKKADQVMGELADKFAKAEDGPQKVKTSLVLLGRAGTALIPVLNQGSDAIKKSGDEFERLGNLLSDKDLKASKEFSENIVKVKTSFEGLSSIIAQSLVPVLDPLARKFADFVAGNKDLIRLKTIEYVRYLSNGVSVLWNRLQEFGAGLSRIAGVVGGFGNLIGVLVASRLTGAAVAFANLTLSVGKLAIALITTPWGLALTALAAIGVVLYKQTEGFKGWGDAFIGTVDEMEKRVKPFVMFMQSVSDNVIDKWRAVTGQKAETHQHDDYQMRPAYRRGQSKTPGITPYYSQSALNDLDSTTNPLLKAGIGANGPNAAQSAGPGQTGMQGILAQLAQMSQAAAKSVGIDITLNTENKVTKMDVDAPNAGPVSVNAGAMNYY